MNRFSGFLGAAGAFVTLFAACGGKVVVDASDTGGAGGTSTTITTADGAPNPTTGVVAPSVTTGSGGPCDPTYTCAAAITPPDVDPAKLCEGSKSAALYQAMIQCACVDTCAIECGSTACIGIDGSPSCKACIQDQTMGCLVQLEACVNDV